MNTSRLTVLDLLRVISIAGVILAHTTGRTLEQSGYDILRVPFSLILNETARFSVPLFFILSGFLLEYSYKGDFVQFYKRRCTRILIPYIVWSIIYYLLYYRNSVKSLFNVAFLKGVLLGTISIQFYFIPSIILLYLLFPFFHKHLSFFTKYIVPLFIGFILVTFADFYYRPNIYDPLKIAFINSFVFLLGMKACHIQDKIREYVRSKRVLIFSILFFSLFGAIYESKYTFLYYKRIYMISSNWRICLYMYTFTFSSIIFAFVATKSKLIERLSRLSYFVFFVHIFFISLFWKLIGSYLFSHSMGHIIEQLWFDPLVFSFTIILSFFSAFIVSKIPVINSVVGIQ